MTEETTRLLADAILERPHEFIAGDRRFSIYPMTLGRSLVQQPLIEAMGIVSANIAVNANIEALRVVKEHRKECLRLIAVCTCKGRKDVMDDSLIEERVEFFGREMTDGDIAALVITVLTADGTERLIKGLGVDKEIADMKKVMDAKKQSDRNSFSFGGLSVYGSFIQPLIEMGFSWDEIVWERSYTNLRLILADKINSVFVSDKERKSVNITRDRERVNGDDRKAIMQAIKSQSWD